MGINKLVKIALVGAVLLSGVKCSSVGYFGFGLKADLGDYRLRRVPVEEIGAGSLEEGISVSAMERTPDDSLYGIKPHFYIGMRAVGNNSSKIVIFDGDNGKPVEAYVVQDR